MRPVCARRLPVSLQSGDAKHALGPVSVSSILLLLFLLFLHPVALLAVRSASIASIIFIKIERPDCLPGPWIARIAAWP